MTLDEQKTHIVKAEESKISYDCRISILIFLCSPNTLDTQCQFIFTITIK